MIMANEGKINPKTGRKEIGGRTGLPSFGGEGKIVSSEQLPGYTVNGKYIENPKYYGLPATAGTYEIEQQRKQNLAKEEATRIEAAQNQAQETQNQVQQQKVQEEVQKNIFGVQQLQSREVQSKAQIEQRQSIPTYNIIEKAPEKGLIEKFSQKVGLGSEQLSLSEQRLREKEAKGELRLGEQAEYAARSGVELAKDTAKLIGTVPNYINKKNIENIKEGRYSNVLNKENIVGVQKPIAKATEYVVKNPLEVVGKVKESAETGFFATGAIAGEVVKESARNPEKFIGETIVLSAGDAALGKVLQVSEKTALKRFSKIGDLGGEGRVSYSYAEGERAVGEAIIPETKVAKGQEFTRPPQPIAERGLELQTNTERVLLPTQPAVIIKELKGKNINVKVTEVGDTLYQTAKTTVKGDTYELRTVSKGSDIQKAELLKNGKVIKKDLPLEFKNEKTEFSLEPVEQSFRREEFVGTNQGLPVALEQERQSLVGKSIPKEKISTFGYEPTKRTILPALPTQEARVLDLVPQVSEGRTTVLVKEKLNVVTEVKTPERRAVFNENELKELDVNFPQLKLVDGDAIRDKVSLEIQGGRTSIREPATTIKETARSSEVSFKIKPRDTIDLKATVNRELPKIFKNKRGELTLESEKEVSRSRLTPKTNFVLSDSRISAISQESGLKLIPAIDIKLRQDVFQRQDQKQDIITEQKTKQESIFEQGIKQDNRIKQDTIQEGKSDLGFKFDLSFRTIQRTQQEQNQELKTEQIEEVLQETNQRKQNVSDSATRTSLDVRTVPKIRPSFSLPKPKAVSGRYKVKVRRKGKFKDVGVYSDLPKAVSEGQKIVKGTVAASFKVERADTGQAIDVKRFVPREFTQSKRDSNVIVQRREDRISSQGEKIGLQQAKRAKIRFF